MKKGTLQEIMTRNILKLSEAEQLVPCSSVTLRRRVAEGRLETFGDPMSVDREHLLAQYRAGFPPVTKNVA